VPSSPGKPPSESDTEFARLANNLPVPFALIDSEERYLLVNSRCEEVLQTPREELIGRPFRETVPSGVHALMRGFVRRALDGENVDFELGLRRSDGRRVWFATHLVPHRNEAGEIDSLYAFSSDITAQHDVREVLQTKRGTLAHTLRLNTARELARAWAHQISQPLNALGGFVEQCSDLLQEPGFDVDAVSDLLHRGSAFALRAGEIVHRIRKFLRADTTQHAPADLRDVVQDATQLIRGEAEMGDCPVLLALPDARLPVLCDRTQLQQACLNILRNAIEASPPSGNGNHSVSVTIERGINGHADVVVRDDGSGLGDDVDGRAFESFFSTKTGRLGLGLTVAQSIVQAHDGQITIEPREDGNPGCTARVRLPLHSESA